MINNKKCIDNYLNALLKNNPIEVQSQMLDSIILLSSALSSNQNIWLFLNSPLMSSSEKNGFLENFSKKLKTDQLVLNLFSLLVKNKRLYLVNDLLKTCKERKDKINSITNIELISSQEFSDKQNKALLKKLNSMGFSNINLSSRIDASLVFGFKLLTENKVYDLSLNSVFEEFKEKIIRN